MNRENFADYLNNPSKLYQLSRAELRGLVIEHPYAPNLRVLYWLKARMENDPAADQLLHQAAARTFDRGHLYLLLHRDILPRLSPAERDEILELKDLSELEKELIPAVRSAAEPPPAAAVITGPTPGGPPPPPPPIDTEADEEPSLPDIALPVAPVAPTHYRLPEHLLGNLVAVTRIAAPAVSPPGEPAFELGTIGRPAPAPVPPAPAPLRPGYRVAPECLADIVAALQSLAFLRDRLGQTQGFVPLPKQRFRGWRERDGRREVMRLRLLDRARRAARATDETEVPESEVRYIARQSVARHGGVVSETLANLFVEQGKYQRAIDMYRELSLRYPEKSTTFAAIIDELQQKH
jgi:hypothetical protein